MYKVTIYKMGKTWDDVQEINKYFKSLRTAQKYADTVCTQENVITVEVN